MLVCYLHTGIHRDCGDTAGLFFYLQTSAVDAERQETNATEQGERIGQTNTVTDKSLTVRQLTQALAKLQKRAYRKHFTRLSSNIWHYFCS